MYPYLFLFPAASVFQLRVAMMFIEVGVVTLVRCYLFVNNCYQEKRRRKHTRGLETHLISVSSPCAVVAAAVVAVEQLAMQSHVKC